MTAVVISQPMLFPWPGFFEQLALAGLAIVAIFMFGPLAALGLAALAAAGVCLLVCPPTPVIAAFVLFNRRIVDSIAITGFR